jgi:xylose isomerase
VRLLETYKYDGPRHFDAHALRTADREDVIAFAKGCMRSYLILKEKAQQFDADPEVKQILATLNVSNPEVEKLSRKYSKDNAKSLRERKFDADALANKPLPYERLDQKLFDILMGVR